VRILFGAGNFIGSNLMVSRFLQNTPNHEIRVAAYYRNHKYLHSIDWCLGALYFTPVGFENYFEKNHGQTGPHVNHDLSSLIIDDLLEWQPELVISDCEPFTAMVAHVLEVPLWYCSAMLQMVGIEHDRKEINTKIFDHVKAYIGSLPQGDAYLVYSSLCDVSARPLLKRGFEWVRPYSVAPKHELTTENIDLSIIRKVLPDKALLTTGETSFISDCLYAGKPIFVSPNPSEVEQVLNAQLLEYYGVGRNIGRSRSLDFVKRVVEQVPRPPLLSVQKWKQLDERL
jgi:hypothetical protein